MGLLPLIPDEMTLGAAAFVGLYGLLAAGCLLYSAWWPFHRASGLLAIFFFSVVISLPVALLNGITVSEWFRGAAPFVFLATFFLFSSASNVGDHLFLSRTILLAFGLWAGKVLWEASPDLPALLTGAGGRLSYYTMDALIPLSLPSLSLLLLEPRVLPSVLRYTGIMLCLLIILLSMYTSQILIAAALVCLHVVRKGGAKSLLPIAGFGIGAVALLTIAPPALIESVTNRFYTHQERGLGERGDELRFAASSFLESPLWGNGLGMKVPMSEIATRADESAYIHNVVMYLLMDLGLLGFIPYASFFALAAWRGIRAGIRRTDSTQLPFAAGVAIAVLMLFFLVQASFRLVHSNLVLAILAVLAWNEPTTK